MRALFPVVRLWKLSIYRWALREIHPLHPDVPYIVRQLRDLEAR
jgi:hypothetical protein